MIIAFEWIRVSHSHQNLIKFRQIKIIPMKRNKKTQVKEAEPELIDGLLQKLNAALKIKNLEIVPIAKVVTPPPAPVYKTTTTKITKKTQKKVQFAQPKPQTEEFEVKTRFPAKNPIMIMTRLGRNFYLCLFGILYAIVWMILNEWEVNSKVKGLAFVFQALKLSTLLIFIGMTIFSTIRSNPENSFELSGYTTKYKSDYWNGTTALLKREGINYPIIILEKHTFSVNFVITTILIVMINAWMKTAFRIWDIYEWISIGIATNAFICYYIMYRIYKRFDLKRKIVEDLNYDLIFEVDKYRGTTIICEPEEPEEPIESKTSTSLVPINQ